MQNAELLWSLVIRLGLGNWVNEVLLRVIILKKLTWKLIQSFSQPSPQAFSARSFLDSTMSCDVTERSKLLNFRVIRRSAKYPCRFPTLSYIISLIDMSHHGEYPPPRSPGAVPPLTRSHLPNMASASWLWRICRGDKANQKRWNILNESVRNSYNLFWKCGCGYFDRSSV